MLKVKGPYAIFSEARHTEPHRKSFLPRTASAVVGRFQGGDNDLSGRVKVQIVDFLGALGSERARDAQADPLPRAGHDGDSIS